MSNLTDALIAAKLVGGSGGSGGGSGLPEITTETVEVVAEQTVAFSSGGDIYSGGIAGEFSINVGDTLIVNWDGTPYTCVVTEFYGSPTWGNFSIEGAGADTGEPFLMGATPGRGIEMETLSGGTHTIQIASEKTNYPDGSILVAINGEWAKAEGYGYSKNGEVHQIDGKYLPFLVINVDTNNKTVDCSYLTYKSAVKSGCPIWICDTENKEYFQLEHADLSITNPSLTGSKWDYVPANPQGSRLQCLVLNVLMEMGDDDWYVDDIIQQSVYIPGV